MNIIKKRFTVLSVATLLLVGALTNADAVNCPSAATIQSARYLGSLGNLIQVLRTGPNQRVYMFFVAKSQIKSVLSKVTGSYAAQATYHSNFPLDPFYACHYKPYSQHGIFPFGSFGGYVSAGINPDTTVVWELAVNNRPAHSKT